MFPTENNIDETPVASVARRARALIVACACDPDNSMEDRNGWHRALHAAVDFDVTVLTLPNADVNRLKNAVPNHLKGRIEFIAVPLPPSQAKRLECDRFFYLGYRAWLVAGKTLAEKLHAERPFAITHLVSLCSYREAGYFWQLDAPFILGPIGGSSGFPVRYLGLLGVRSAVFELVRNVLNYYQLHFSPRVRRAIKESSYVFAANRSTQRDLVKMTGGTEVPVELETGLDYECGDPKEVRDTKAPLKILWSGRLRAWKGLPLLLHAIANLPNDIKVQVRVVGDGVEGKGWRILAKRLGIEDRVEWFPRPPYRDSIEYYQWADVFSFTSLRDTSGTGLLEALAAGTPIIGMNHQGAADIMTDDCAIKISVSTPGQSVREIADAIVMLAGDPDRLKKLSDGALKQAVVHQWSHKFALMRLTYQDLLRVSKKDLDSPISPPQIPSELN